MTNFIDTCNMSEDKVFGLHEENYDLREDEGACGPTPPDMLNWMYDSSVEGDFERAVSEHNDAVVAFHSNDNDDGMSHCAHPCCMEGSMYCCHCHEECNI